MSLLTINYFSNALKKSTTFHMILPNDVDPMTKHENKNYERPMKSLYLLHGYCGNSYDWVVNSLTQEMALKYNLAIIMPSGDNSFYLNGKGTGHRYADFLGKELVDYVNETFGLSNQKEDIFVAGLSMGGFGAIHTGLAFPDTFGKIAAFSSALIVNKLKTMQPGTTNEVADYDYYASVFGELDQLDQSVNNPEYLIHKLKEEGTEIPPIFMACGSEDFLADANHEFRDFLEKENVVYIYKESHGVHDWKFWNEYLEPSIQWMLEIK